jgi:hypothetical protein
MYVTLWLRTCKLSSSSLLSPTGYLVVSGEKQSDQVDVTMNGFLCLHCIVEKHGTFQKKR